MFLEIIDDSREGIDITHQGDEEPSHYNAKGIYFLDRPQVGRELIARGWAREVTEARAMELARGQEKEFKRAIIRRLSDGSQSVVYVPRHPSEDQINNLLALFAVPEIAAAIKKLIADGKMPTPVEINKMMRPPLATATK